ncbi:MAG: hypothetical protein RSJ41_09630 [Clostridia bacterium]
MTYTTLTMSQTHDGKRTVLNLPTIKLNKNAKKQLRAIYANMGGRILCSLRLRFELGEYVRYREAGSEPLDTLGQTLRFDEHLAVCMVKIHGQWIVTDVWALSPVTAFLPVMMWKRVKEGICEVARRVLIGWRYVIRRGGSMTSGDGNAQ